jgi:hypothetical protein
VSIPAFDAPLTLENAAAWMDKVCERLGAGFHPDTRGRDYVVGGTDGSSSLDSEEANRLDAGVERLFELAADPYELSIAALRRWAEKNDPDLFARFV